MTELLIAALVMLLLWTFWSGFTDASNSITTIVSTGVLKPLQAVTLASLGNLMGIFLGEAVATTVGKGIIRTEIVSGMLVITALLGGMIWDVFTYYKGLPISETQVLVGALIGSGIAVGGFEVVEFGSVVRRIVVPMASAPIIAFLSAVSFVALLVRIFWRMAKEHVNKYFGRLQILSSLFFSVTHGANDAMKTAGVMAALLVYYRAQADFAVPLWAILISLAALASGTFFGGWRIVKTMGFRLTRLQPWQGFCAETAAALVVGIASRIGFPLSTSQTVSGSIMGVGVTTGSHHVRWRVARHVFLAWVLTIPMSALSAYLVTKLAMLIVGLEAPLSS